MNLTNKQIAFLLNNLVGNNTYTILDEPNNRFNFMGISETVDRELYDRALANCKEVYPINSRELFFVLKTYEDNGVDLKDYTYVMEMKDGESTIYILLWGTITYDVWFNDSENSDRTGFEVSFEECWNFIRNHNGSNHSYFADYKKGTVSIVCNETEEVAHEELVRTRLETEVEGYSVAVIYETASTYIIDLRTGLGEAIYPKDQFTLDEAIADQVNIDSELPL